MLSNRVSLGSLAILCRSLSTMLDSGVTAHKAFEVAGEKAGTAAVQRAARGISEQVRAGEEIATAMEEQQAFPHLLVLMTRVGEQTGALPEILRGLADHYENLLRLRKNFYRSIAWPVIQFVLAVFVIAGLIFMLGWIADTRGTEAIDVLGWGLLGASGALTWLGMVFGTLFLLWFIYRMIRASVEGQRYLDAQLLRVPVLGRCLRAFAIARFAWSYHLTQEAGMPVDESVHSAMQATNNGAFMAAAGYINAAIHSGESVTEALRSTGLFPRDVIEMIHVGETTGTVPEALQRLSPHFEDEARRALETLAGMLGWIVWVIVAVFIIFVVFSIMLWYIGLINEAVQAL